MARREARRRGSMSRGREREHGSGSERADGGATDGHQRRNGLAPMAGRQQDMAANGGRIATNLKGIQGGLASVGVGAGANLASGSAFHARLGI